MDIRKSGLTSNADSGAYTDLSRLNNLKVGDRDSEANQRKVAQEFESLFLNEMLKSMRSANEVLGKDNPMNTPAAKQYQEMYDQQLAVSLSREGHGIGLADVLMRQMSKNKSNLVPAHTVATATPVSTAPGPLERSSGQRPLWATRVPVPANYGAQHSNDMALMNQRRLSLPPRLTDRLLAGIVPSADSALADSRNKALPSRATASTSTAPTRIYGLATLAQPPLAPPRTVFNSPDDFVATMLPMAKQAARRIGVDPFYLVAQAALETGWGKSVMRQQDGSNSHNLFGIKAGDSWQGAQARAITSEFTGGQRVREAANFRSYASYQDSFHDLVNVLQGNSRYQEVLRSADNPERYVKELQKAGYATDPDYASKISQIARQMKNYQSYAAMTGASTNL